MCESDKRMSRIIKLMLRERGGEEGEQEMEKNERENSHGFLPCVNVNRLCTSECVCFLFYSLNLNS